MAKKRKGPTPRRRQPKQVWKARCENCGFIDDLCPRPVRGLDNYSPCPRCEGVTARYVSVAA